MTSLINLQNKQDWTNTQSMGWSLFTSSSSSATTATTFTCLGIVKHYHILKEKNYNQFPKTTENLWKSLKVFTLN